ncbi:MAG: EAL domain-containing protein [Limnothrix sp. RL_2_0]|nr:EAL domain-containing protein [Limnothrix sp. RL_2_0]
MISKPFFKWSDHLLPRLILPALIASLGITGAIAIARNLGWLQNLELTIFDRMVRLQPDSELDDRFLVVEIRDADLQAFRQIPLTDEIIATALATIQKHNPRVIGLDIYRDIPNPPGTELLKAQLNRENVILIENLSPDTTVPRPPEVAARSGFNVFVIDPDNVQRRNMLAVQTDKIYLSFGLLVAQTYLGADQYPVDLDGQGLTFGPHYFPAINTNSGGYQLPESEAKGWQTLLTFASEANISPSINISDLLVGNFEPDDIADRIVLLGSTAASQKDSFLTPYSASRTDGHMTPGVFLHAQAIQQILKTVDSGNHFFAFWTEGQEIVWIFAWACFGGASTWLFYRTRLFIAVSAIGSLGLVLGGYGLFLMNVWVPVAAAAIALVASWSSVLAYRLFYEEKYDVLTGLPNARYFLDQLSKINQSLPHGNVERQIAVLSLDINRFKSINESYGHYYGDMVLKQIVKRISDLIEDGIVLARIGANEFGILIKSPKLKQEVIDIIHAIEKSLNEPFCIEHKQHYLTCSTGVAFYQKDELITPEALWLKAHTAMNRAKQSHKNHYKIFAEGMQTQSINRLTIESDLRQAIANQEFELLYQPIFSLKTDIIKGFEALVRWNSPSRGVVSPNDFINIAEETDLIIPISQWVLEEGCRQFKEWQDELGLDASITISINLSSRQFSQNNLKKQVEEILERTGLDPSALKLEITESTVMDDIEEAARMLKELKTINVRLSVDDFGTGYSSLSYLSNFPIDTLKIDRSFVDKIKKDNDSLAIPNALVMLGHSLGMDIIAEGIETPEQLEILKKIGCEFGQGFYFSKPLNKKDATRFIKRWSHNKFDACIAANVEEL